MQLSFPILGLLFFLSAVSGDVQPPTAAPTCSNEVEHAKLTSKPIAAFALQLYKKLVAAEPDKNIVFSPVSIALALSLVEPGATGETKAELDRLLFGTQHETNAGKYEALNHHLKTTGITPISRTTDTRPANTHDQHDPHHPSITLNIANGLFVDKDLTLKPEYLQRAKCFQAAVENVNFRETAPATRKINNWIANATNNRIRDLITPDALGGAKSVLTNAVYFKSSWMERMHLIEGGADFYRFGRDDDKRKVPFMTITKSFNYVSDDDFHIVELPYIGNLLSMYIVLPKQRNGMQTVEQQLTTEKFQSLKERFAPRRVNVQLPKFSIRTGGSLKRHLNALGVNKAFSDLAELHITAETRLKISDVLHESFIKVNENGTEAAAATVVITIVPLSMSNITPPPPIVFIADHPFIFSIVHKATKVPVFLGKVNFIEDLE